MLSSISTFQSIAKINNIPSSTPPTTSGLEFYLSFGSSIVPTTDAYGFRLVKNGTPTMVNNPIRGNVFYTVTPNQSISTNYPTPATFTRSFWIYLFNASTSVIEMVMSYNAHIYIYQGVVNVGFNYNTTNNNMTSTLPASNVWLHYAVTYDRTTKTALLYRDGFVVSTLSGFDYPGDGSGLNNGGGLTIGDYVNTGMFGSNAYFDNIRGYNRVLSAAEISNIYNYEKYNPFVIIGLIINYGFNSGDSSNNTIINYARNNYDATLIGTVSISTTTYKVGTGSLFFSNANPGALTQYVTIPSIILTTTTVSFSCWFRIPSFSAGGDAMTIFEIGNASGGDHIRFFFWNNTKYLVATINSQDKNIVLLTSYVNTWVHAVWVINGANWTIYLNNVSVYSTTNNNLLTINTKSSSVIGRSPTWGNQCMYGYIDDFRIFNNEALSSSQVNSLYNAQ